MAVKNRRYLTPLEVEAVQARTDEDRIATGQLDQRLRAGGITEAEADLERGAIYRASAARLKHRLHPC
ncbi:MAG: hypothetical protein Q7O66_19885 [Dehalococcoidia bacterium]|nr:hypothetical protein [Dehalococcoidia bacterium]